jgi:hypothetical protein
MASEQPNQAKGTSEGAGEDALAAARDLGEDGGEQSPQSLSEQVESLLAEVARVNTQVERAIAGEDAPTDLLANMDRDEQLIAKLEEEGDKEPTSTQSEIASSEQQDAMTGAVDHAEDSGSGVHQPGDPAPAVDDMEDLMEAIAELRGPASEQAVVAPLNALHAHDAMETAASDATNDAKNAAQSDESDALGDIAATLAATASTEDVDAQGEVLASAAQGGASSDEAHAAGDVQPMGAQTAETDSQSPLISQSPLGDAGLLDIAEAVTQSADTTTHSGIEASVNEASVNEGSVNEASAMEASELEANARDASADQSGDVAADAASDAPRADADPQTIASLDATLASAADAQLAAEEAKAALEASPQAQAQLASHADQQASDAPKERADDTTMATPAAQPEAVGSTPLATEPVREQSRTSGAAQQEAATSVSTGVPASTNLHAHADATRAGAGALAAPAVTATAQATKLEAKPSSTGNAQRAAEAKARAGALAASIAGGVRRGAAAFGAIALPVLHKVEQPAASVLAKAHGPLLKKPRSLRDAAGVLSLHTFVLGCALWFYAAVWRSQHQASAVETFDFQNAGLPQPDHEPGLQEEHGAVHADKGASGGGHGEEKKDGKPAKPLLADPKKYLVNDEISTRAKAAKEGKKEGGGH